MKIDRIYALLFISFAAFLATLWDYQFGTMDHVEHLPLLFRAEDPNYLANDFTLNANQQNYDPRYYYSLVIIFFKAFLPLPLVFFGLTYLCNFVLAVASYQIGKFIFNTDRFAGLIIASLSLSLRTVELGSVAECHTNSLTPNALAFSFVLLTLNLVLREKWILSGLFLGLISMIHPLVGPECGMLFLGVGLLQIIITKPFDRIKLKQWATGMVIFLVFVSISVIPFFINKGTEIDDKTFIELYAHFRGPHHLIPSVFMTADEIKFGVYYLILLILCFFAWIYTVKDRKTIQWIVITYILIIFSLSVANYYFAEVYPLKIAIIAQAFRLLYLPKWFFIILFGGLIGKNISVGSQKDKLFAFAALISSFNPLFLIYILLLWGISTLIHRRFNPNQIFFFTETTLIFIIAVYAFIKSFETTVWTADIYVWLCFIILLPLFVTVKIPFAYHYSCWLLILTVLLTYWSGHKRIDAKNPFTKAISKQYNLNDFPEELKELSQKIKALTPENAILLAPPMLGELRYLADRALVVNFKTFPFKGKKMLEWRDRLFDCYTWTDKKGFDAATWAFEPNYKVIDKNRLEMIQKKYGSDYAVLYSETVCQFPVLFENKVYKLIYIGNKQ
jgi:hypothetical protein